MVFSTPVHRADGWETKQMPIQTSLMKPTPSNTLLPTSQLLQKALRKLIILWSVPKSIMKCIADMIWLLDSNTPNWLIQSLLNWQHLLKSCMDLTTRTKLLTLTEERCSNQETQTFLTTKRWLLLVSWRDWSLSSQFNFQTRNKEEVEILVLKSPTSYFCLKKDCQLELNISKLLPLIWDLSMLTLMISLTDTWTLS